MKLSIYLDTSTISYLTTQGNRDLIIATHQQITQQWWQQQSHLFDLYVSELVWKEAQLGDSQEANKRLSIINQLQLLPMTPVAEQLGQHLIQKRILPPVAAADGLHIAIATIHGMDYLMTWNLKHIANPMIQKSVRKLIEAQGYEMPTFCTPEQLFSGE